MNYQITPSSRTVHTMHQTLLAFYVEYNRHLFRLWRNGRTDSAAYQLCLKRIRDLRGRIPQTQRIRAMHRFNPYEQLTASRFFSNNGSERSTNLEPLFLPVVVPNVLFQEEAHVSN